MAFNFYCNTADDSGGNRGSPDGLGALSGSMLGKGDEAKNTEEGGHDLEI